MPAGASPRFFHVVSPDYFATIKLPILAGRGFTDADRDGAERVVIINKRMAETLWPSTSAIGKHVKLGPADSLPWLTVVGISGDVRGGDRLNTQFRNYAYVPIDAVARRSHHDPRSVSGESVPSRSALRAAVARSIADLPVIGVQTVEQQHHGDYWPYELFAIAMGSFAGFARAARGRRTVRRDRVQHGAADARDRRPDRARRRAPTRGAHGRWPGRLRLVAAVSWSARSAPPSRSGPRRHVVRRQPHRPSDLRLGRHVLWPW